MKLRWLVAAGLMFGTAAGAAAPADTAFLTFPMVVNVSAARAPAVAWVIRQGDQTRLRVVRAPDYKPVDLFTQPDVDGQPITDIRMSPDGRRIAFVTGTSIGGREEGYNPAGLLSAPKATIWLIDARAGAKPVKLGSGVDPNFTPDGRLLTFRRGRDLWSLDPAGDPDKAAALIPGGGAYGDPVWTADGKSMFFVQDRGGWSMLGRWDAGSDRVRWLVTGAERIAAPALSPDGRTIVYFRLPAREHGVTYDQTENQTVAIKTVDVATGAITPLWQSPDKAGSFTADDDGASLLRWADDRSIVFRAEQDGWARLYALPRAGGAPRALTPGECEVAESELTAPDTLFVLHNCRDIDTRQASVITVSTGKERPVASSDLVLANAAAIGDAGLVAYTGASADQPSLLRILDLKTGRSAFADSLAANGYAHRFTAPAPQAVRFKATDGATVPGQLFLPAGPGPHPALVYVHGGPSRQMFPSFHFSDYYANDYAMNRRLAELGYVVLAINYRSGVGYGRGWREAPGRAWRDASEYRDVLGAGRWLAARKDVDRKRVGIWGGSYGGLLTGQALARNSDVFAAGVAIHGVFDWSWPSPTPAHLNPSKFFGVNEADRKTALAASPVGAIDSWKSPVLLFSGDQDMNVDVLETVDLTRKLKDRGVDVRNVILPGEGHSFLRHSSWLRLWEEQERFLAEQLRP
jgi:dipeptidyl aminopeptidase/acylaminoacyl peptidase